MLQRGFVEVRVWVPALCYIGAAVLLIPGLVAATASRRPCGSTSRARRCWRPPTRRSTPPDSTSCPRACGAVPRAREPCVRSLAQALAPILFGGLADLIAGIAPSAGADRDAPARPDHRHRTRTLRLVPDPPRDARRSRCVPAPRAPHLST